MKKESASSVGHLPGEKWKFDTKVAACFEDMLRRSIPQYDVMRALVFDIGARFPSKGTSIVDLGCSRGDALAPFIEKFAYTSPCIGVEVSAPMLAIAQKRFATQIGDGQVRIENTDLRQDYPTGLASLTLSIFTMQFIPIEHRQKVLSNVARHTIPGGALLMAEKILGDDADLDALLVETYYKMKRDNGYSQEEIDRKKLSLEGVLVPVTARWNEELLRGAGFKRVECVWRWCNFAMWLAIK